jgi:hypothetical protein
MYGHCDVLMWHGIMTTGTGVQAILRFCLCNLNGSNLGIIDGNKRTVEMGSGVMIYIPSFMKIGKGAKGILGSCLSNLKGCNTGITDGRDL